MELPERGEFWGLFQEGLKPCNSKELWGVTMLRRGDSSFCRKPRYGNLEIAQLSTGDLPRWLVVDVSPRLELRAGLPW